MPTMSANKCRTHPQGTIKNYAYHIQTTQYQIKPTTSRERNTKSFPPHPQAVTTNHAHHIHKQIVTTNHAHHIHDRIVPTCGIHWSREGIHLKGCGSFQTHMAFCHTPAQGKCTNTSVLDGVPGLFLPTPGIAGLCHLFLHQVHLDLSSMFRPGTFRP